MSKPLSINHADRLIIIDDHPATRVQSFGYEPAFASEDVYEIGNPNIVQTRVDDVIPTTTNITALDWGTIDLLKQLCGRNSGLSASDNAGTVTESHLKNAISDIVIKTDESGSWKRSTWLPNQHLSSFSFSYSVDGNAQETYTLNGDSDYDFPETYREVAVVKGTYATASTFTVPTSATGYAADFITINGIIYTSGFSWATTTVTVSGALAGTLKSTDRLRLVHHKTSPSSSFTKLNTAGFTSVRNGQVKIGLGSEAAVTTSTKTLRVQSVTINCNIERDQDKELGTKQLTGRTWKSTVFDVNVTVNASDLQEYAYFCGVSTSDWSDWANNDQILYPQLLIGKEQELIVQVYDDADQSNLLKTITMDNLQVVGKGSRHDVQGKEQISWTLRGSTISVAGNGVPSNSELDGANVYPSIW